jgi:DNA helicase II / ATP-dependent DNA helicase PcrA
MQVLDPTAEQLAFLDHDPSHHARVLAGPGTGKSLTSVAFLERLASLHPDLRARMLTFTRAATAEFAQKMGDAELEGLGVTPPATVHSFALSVLMKTKGSGLPMPLRIPDSWEAKELIRPHLSRRLRAAGHRDATPSLVEKLELEMAAGWESLDPQQMLFTELRPELRSAYTGLWSRHRRVFGHVLLAELPYRAGLVLEDVGADAVDLDVLLVDEYQDLNEADIKMIRLVAEGGVSVLAIGDDDQSIYSFRMAAPAGIRRFLQEFDTQCDYPLSVSRRCGKAILAAANSLIQSEPERPAKPPLFSAPDTPEGCFAHLRFPSSEAEVAGVARIIASRIAQGVPPAKIAVLVRSNLDRWATALRPALEARDINLASTEWVTQALQEPEMRRAIAFSHLVLENSDSLSWWTLLHLTSGVGPSFIDYVYENCSEEETFGEVLLRLHEVGYPYGPAATRIVGSLVKDMLNALQEIDLEAVLLDDRGWAGWLLDQLDRSLLSNEAIELIETVGQHVIASDGLGTLLANLEPLGKDLAASSIDAVRMMTMGRSKGLTLNTVVVMGVEDGMVPMPPPKGKIDEERRLLYVAMTRATDMCVLTWAGRRRGPIARQGRPNVNQPRRRSPLLEDLTIGRWQDGLRFVRDLQQLSSQA